MRVLISAASKHGSTAEIAESIGRVLRSAGLETIVMSPEKVASLGPYDAVVLGSAVYVGRWMDSATAFATRHEIVLKRRPVWLFSSGPLGEPPQPIDTVGRGERDEDTPRGARPPDLHRAPGPQLPGPRGTSDDRRGEGPGRGLPRLGRRRGLGRRHRRGTHHRHRPVPARSGARTRLKPARRGRAKWGDGPTRRGAMMRRRADRSARFRGGARGPHCPQCAAAPDRRDPSRAGGRGGLLGIALPPSGRPGEINADGATELDAEGQLLSSPLVDPHVHLDAVLTVGEPALQRVGHPHRGDPDLGRAQADPDPRGREATRPGGHPLGGGPGHRADPLPRRRVRPQPGRPARPAGAARGGPRHRGPAPDRVPAGRDPVVPERQRAHARGHAPGLRRHRRHPPLRMDPRRRGRGGALHLRPGARDRCAHRPPLRRDR